MKDQSLFTDLVPPLAPLEVLEEVEYHDVLASGTAETIAQLIAGALSAVDAEKRSEVFGILSSRFCFHCGNQQSDTKWCQCMNDE